MLYICVYYLCGILHRLGLCCSVLGHILMTVMRHTNVPHSANVLGQACLTMSCIDILSGIKHFSSDMLEVVDHPRALICQSGGRYHT